MIGDAGQRIGEPGLRIDAVELGGFDLAVLETGAHFTSVATFRADSADVGEPVAVIGFPLQGILSSGGTVSFGHISALGGIANDWQKLQISAPVQAGNSGGPLFDQGGLLLGVVVQKLDALKVARVTVEQHEAVSESATKGA